MCPPAQSRAPLQGYSRRRRQSIWPGVLPFSALQAQADQRASAQPIIASKRADQQGGLSSQPGPHGRRAREDQEPCRTRLITPPFRLQILVSKPAHCRRPRRRAQVVRTLAVLAVEGKQAARSVWP
ncbi:hypothetical protein CC78DRAFT_29793 [Lojkania enalia]|uniref:Uncharacterized protein n=1 Tax=Lojkania enalia TaxID=147567 RepID=A0A9P4MWJ4_9PLEO|nr:hypothetical protein CC78DRAFT_29793 [Didymosphaeria enalia]